MVEFKIVPRSKVYGFENIFTFKLMWKYDENDGNLKFIIKTLRIMLLKLK